MSHFEQIMAAIGAVIALLGYIAWGVTRARRVIRKFDQFMSEHQVLLDAAHIHEHGQIMRVAYRTHHRRDR